jgi:ADP-ribose pyrophosphatase
MPSRTPPLVPPHIDVEQLSNDRVWNGRFPLDVIRFRHRRFDGDWSGIKTWEVWRRGRAAAILPYDPVADAVVLIEQFRLPALVAGMEPVMVEVPAGLCDADETAEVTARREAAEEMGLQVGSLKRIGGFLLTPGGADECCELFVGRVQIPEVATDGIVGHAGVADEHEDIRIRTWSADRAIAAAVAGEMPNSVTSISLLWLAAQRPALRKEWI